MDEAVAKRKADAAAARAREDNNLRAVLETAAGREVLERIIYRFGALKTLGFNADASLRDFHAGQRGVGVAIEREVKRVDVDLWALMEHERTERIKLEPKPTTSEAELDEDGDE